MESILEDDLWRTSGDLRLTLSHLSGREMCTDVTTEAPGSQPVTQRNDVKKSQSLTQAKGGPRKTAGSNDLCHMTKFAWLKTYFQVELRPQPGYFEVEN